MANHTYELPTPLITVESQSESTTIARVGGSRLVHGVRESMVRRKRDARRKRRAAEKMGISSGRELFALAEGASLGMGARSLQVPHGGGAGGGGSGGGGGGGGGGGDTDFTRWIFPRGAMGELKYIGEGNFGKVYSTLAKGIVKGQEDTNVAVKTLQGDSKELEAEFRAEAQIMMDIDGPHNIVRLLGVCVEKRPHLMIMEFMARGDLKGVLVDARPTDDSPSPLSHAKMAAMAADVAEGMAYLASRSIVHRDLAARNCLVAQDWTCKVGDFGLTRDVYAREYYRMTGSAPLPIRWMSPEAITYGLFTTASDIWSFGVTLWEIAAMAQTPYGSLENMEVVDKLTEEGYRLPPPPCCPAGFPDLLTHCWQDSPEARGTFDELHATLRELVGLLPNDPIERGAGARAAGEAAMAAAAAGLYDTAGTMAADEERAYEEPQDAMKGGRGKKATRPVSVFVQMDEEEGGAHGGGKTGSSVLADVAGEHLYESTGAALDLEARLAYPTLRRRPRKSLRRMRKAAKAATAATATAVSAAAPSSPSANTYDLITPGSGGGDEVARLYALARAPESPSSSEDDAVVALAAELYTMPLSKAQRAAKKAEADAALPAAPQLPPKKRLHAKATADDLEKAAGHCRVWLAGLTGRTLAENLHAALKDGTVLCDAANAISPGAVEFVHRDTRTAFKHYANIGNFLKFAAETGVATADLFVTSDLYDDSNLKQVICTVLALEKVADVDGSKDLNI